MDLSDFSVRPKLKECLEERGFDLSGYAFDGEGRMVPHLAL